MYIKFKDDAHNIDIQFRYDSTIFDLFEGWRGGTQLLRNFMQW